MPDYQYTAEPPGHPKKRRPASFVLRLTFGQFLRMLRIFLAVDVLVAVLWLGLTVTELERTATSLFLLPSREAAARTAEIFDAAVLTEEAPPHTFDTDRRLERWLGLTPGAKRSLSLGRSEPNPELWGWERRPEYTVAVEVSDGNYHIAVFDLSRRFARFCTGMLALAGIELLMLISNTAGVRRAVKRTLAPIQQLTAAARNMGGRQEQPPREKREKSEKLELSGTINTLNSITAKQLDTRIPIDSERAELQGLAYAINGMLDRLDEAYSSQARFVSDASHELRTPIAVIQGYANLLDRWGKEDPAALQESIEAIKAEAEGMQELVEQLLFLARSDNDTIAMQVAPLDISALASEVLRDAQIVDKAHEFTADIDPLRVVDGDAGLLKQALRIFVDNAVKYSPAGEFIKVSVKTAADQVMVSVTDNGIGIPEEDLPHVVERFFRSDESRARTTGGTGLGLSIADWIIRRHGGHLEILSRRDIGTRMTMVLPVSRAGAGEDGEGETA